MRIGTTVLPAGKAWSTDSGNTGELKLRVRDNKHTDNSGNYTVMIVVVPDELVKAGCQKVDVQGATTPCF
jgi:hypothetical protein